MAAPSQGIRQIAKDDDEIWTKLTTCSRSWWLENIPLVIKIKSLSAIVAACVKTKTYTQDYSGLIYSAFAYWKT